MSLKRRWQRLKTSFERRFFLKPFYGNYTGDFFSVRTRSVEFMAEPRFAEAWSKAVAANQDIWRGGVPDIRWRAHVACWAAAHGLQLEGDFVECGVFGGLLSMTICGFLDFNRTGRSFYLYDTYEGIPLEGLGEKDLDTAQKANQAKYFDCYALAKRNFAPFPKARLVRGRVPESFAEAPDKVAYLSLDMNNAPAEIAAIEFFWDRLSPSAIVVLDDYGWIGAEAQRGAMNQFASGKGLRIVSLPTGQGLLIKPPRRSI